MKIMLISSHLQNIEVYVATDDPKLILDRSGPNG
jgi:hypothetical protein